MTKLAVSDSFLRTKGLYLSKRKQGTTMGARTLKICRNDIISVIPDLTALSPTGVGQFAGAAFQLDPTTVKWKTTQQRLPPRNKGSKDIELQATGWKITLRKSYWTSYSGDTGELSGTCTHIHLVADSASPSTDVRFRSIIYLDKQADLTLPHFIEDETGRSNSHWLPLVVDGRQLDFYYLQAQNWIVFDAPRGVTYEEFQKLSGTTRLLFSYILGIGLDQRSCELALSADLKTVYEAWFYAGRKRGGSIYAPIPSSWGHWALAKQQITIPQDMRHLDDAILSRVWSNLLKWPELAASIEYLLAFPPAPVEMRGALLSVALESLTSSIAKKIKITTPKPLEKALWKQLRKNALDFLDMMFKRSLIAKLINALEEQGGSWEESTKKILTDRINELNKPTNRAKLTAPFHHFGIAISEQDEEAIGRRNDFLHRGQLLDEEERKNGDWKDVYYTEMKIYTLTNRLLLAALEYEGPVINWGDTLLGGGETQYLYQTKIGARSSDENLRQ